MASTMVRPSKAAAAGRDGSRCSQASGMTATVASTTNGPTSLI